MNKRISNLTKNEAKLRSDSKINNIQYNCYLNLINNEKNYFNGFVEIQFDVEVINKIFINYNGAKIEKLIINGSSIDNLDEYLKNNWIDSNLFIPQNLIKNKNNIIELRFLSYYSRNGDGLFLTSGEGEHIYKYSQTAPFGLNKIFPCFDQPDLKGKVKYFFTCSKNEEIITTEFCQNYYENYEVICYDNLDNFGKKIYNYYGNNLSNLWIFNNSKLLSSYLLGFSVGEFAKFTLDIEKHKFKIPISIYCRKSLKKYLEKQLDDIYYPMMKGILMYEEYFGINYSFSKNDLIFLPEFKYGAMEYPGCITINERHLLLDKIIPPIKTLTRSHTIYHEIAHMWFGNLVTMKWWDDLWLNESFAELISVMIMEFTKDPCNTINYDTNLMLRTDWGLETDEKKSTHPISCNVENTLMSESIFDGISYSKGPYVLKQLIYNIGLDKFKENLQNYFKKYKWGNTDLNMFLEEMSNGLSFNIKEFNDDFIQKACLNRLTYTREITGINIIQSFVLEEFNYLRNHKIMIAFFNENSDLIETKELYIRKIKNNFIELDSSLLKESKVIFINYNFNTWVRFNLDDESNNFILKNIKKFKKYSFNLKIFLSNYYSLVRDSINKSVKYLNNMIEIIDDICDDQIILSEVLANCQDCIKKFMPEKYQAEYSTKFNNKLFEILIKIEDKIICKKIFEYFLNSCNSGSSILSLKVILDGEFCNTNLLLDIKDKWDIYFILVTSGLMCSSFEDEYYNKIKIIDDTDEKNKILISLEAFKADKEKRKELFKVYIDGNSSLLNYKQKLISIKGYTSGFLKEKIRYDYYDEFFVNIIKVFRNYGFNNGDDFIKSLCPNLYRLENNIIIFEDILLRLKDNEKSFKASVLSKIEDLNKIKKHFEKFFK